VAPGLWSTQEPGPGLWAMLGEVPGSRQLQLCCFWSSEAGAAPGTRGVRVHREEEKETGTKSDECRSLGAEGFVSAGRGGPRRRCVCAWWPVWSVSWRAFRRLLSAFLTCLSCPSVCLRPLCPGAALPAPGGSVGSVNGYHTCKGELAVTAAPARACRGRLAVSLSFFVGAFPPVRV